VKWSKSVARLYERERDAAQAPARRM